MGLSEINDVDLENEQKSLNKLFECMVLSQYSGHRKCDFYAAPSA